MTALLTVARKALWNCIDNWSELKKSPGDAGSTIFNQTYRFDSEMPLLEEIAPSISDLPALAIMPSSVVPVWWTNEMQQWPATYDIVLWTQDWSLPEAEDLIEKVINAIYRSVHPQSGSTPFSFIKAPSTATPPGTGYYPQRLGPITFARTKIQVAGDDDPIRVMQTTVQMTIRNQKDPFSP